MQMLLMRRLVVAGIGTGLLLGCSKHEASAPAHSPVEVTVVKIQPQDAPVAFEYVGQSASSHQVQIVARVGGFLDKRAYTEGAMVKAGDLMFLQDPRPFQATLDAYKGALAEQQARLKTANDNLAQVKPLAAQGALSQKELDDATGQQQTAAAAVETAKANVVQAELNLGYATIRTPIAGLSSFARVQEGQYLNGQSTLLTTVDQIDPIWVNFTLSENEMVALRAEESAGRLALPRIGEYDVEVVLADGTLFPNKGRIVFANAEFDPQTGTFLLRASLPNPKLSLRPGQFVRVRVKGAVRPKAILVPQEAVLQGAHGHFVIVVDKDGKAAIRPVQVGSWNGSNWFVNDGLAAGDLVVTSGVVRLAPGAPVKVVEAQASAASAAKKQ